MKAKKLAALIFCLVTTLVIFAFSASAQEPSFCEHGEEYYEWVEYSQSCTSNGSYRYTCKYETEDGICGNVAKTEIIPAHDFRMIYMGKVANCTEEGFYTRYCPWCQTLENVITPVNPDGHNYFDGEILIEPTCKTEGTREIICNRCGDTSTTKVPVDTQNHVAKNAQWTVITEQTSLCVEGKETNVCAECNAAMERVIPRHTDYTDTEKYNIIKQTPATCTTGVLTEYLCKKCGDVFTVEGERDENAHDFTNEKYWEIPDGVTCSSEVKIIKHCKHNYIHKIEANSPHDFSGEVTEYIAPDCNAEGSRTVKCLYCEEAETTVIPAEHSFGAWSLNGSCAVGGTATRRCSCGEKTEEITFSADEHLNYTVLKEVSGSCLYEGYLKIRCNDCGAERKYFPEELASKGGHTPGAWIISEASTCQKSGKRERHCEECGELLETEILPQREHSCVILEEGIPATCSEPGITDYLYCTMCTGIFDQEITEALGHNFVEQKKPGEGAVKICDRCYEYEVGEGTTCSCLCHNSNGLAKFIYKIIIVFSKIFGINQECKCGIAHY